MYWLDVVDEVKGGRRWLVTSDVVRAVRELWWHCRETEKDLRNRDDEANTLRGEKRGLEAELARANEENLRLARQANELLEQRELARLEASGLRERVDRLRKALSACLKELEGVGDIITETIQEVKRWNVSPQPSPCSSGPTTSPSGTPPKSGSSGSTGWPDCTIS